MCGNGLMDRDRLAARRDAALVCAWVGAAIVVPLLAVTALVATGGPASDLLLFVAVPILVFGRGILAVPFVLTGALGLAALFVGLAAPRPGHVVAVAGGGVAASAVGVALVATLPLP